MSLNRYVAGLACRTENKRAICSFEFGFLNDVNSVFSL